jgi:hypothetical protein
MTTSADILADGFERIRVTSRSAGRGLTSEILEGRLDPAANTISWLLWHLARGQDAQIADLTGDEQLWTADGWSALFAIDLPVNSTGYGHTADDVAKVSGVSSDHLLGYIDAVCDRSSTYVRTLTDEDLGEVVDERFTPPVTRGVRLVSVISDNLQHSGQAAFIRGVLERTV